MEKNMEYYVQKAEECSAIASELHALYRSFSEYVSEHFKKKGLDLAVQGSFGWPSRTFASEHSKVQIGITLLVYPTKGSKVEKMWISIETSTRSIVERNRWYLVVEDIEDAKNRALARRTTPALTKEEYDKRKEVRERQQLNRLKKKYEGVKPE